MAYFRLCNFSKKISCKHIPIFYETPCNFLSSYARKKLFSKKKRGKPTGCLIKNGDMFAWYLFKNITEPKISFIILWE